MRSELKCHSTLPEPNNDRQQQKTLREMEYKAHSHAAIHVDVALRLPSVVPRRSRSTQLIICSFCSHCSTASHSCAGWLWESPLSLAKKSTFRPKLLPTHSARPPRTQLRLKTDEIFSMRYSLFPLFVPSWGSRCRVGRAATKQENERQKNCRDFLRPQKERKNCPTSRFCHRLWRWPGNTNSNNKTLTLIQLIEWSTLQTHWEG